MPRIELITTIKAPLERCFNLARSIDLHRISTKGTNEKAIAGVTTGLIGMGEQVTWRATHFGIRQTLTSEITSFNYPYSFRDEMIEGAFNMIRHDHIFSSDGEYTEMKDEFCFETPGGIFGDLANRLILSRYLRNLLLKRNHVIKEVAESDAWREILNESIETESKTL